MKVSVTEGESSPSHLITDAMNLFELHKKLIATARGNPPNARVPLAFEKRIIALLPQQAVDGWAQWAAALWRAAVPCIAIMLLLGAWSFLGGYPATGSSDLSQDIDNTILAAADQDQQPSDSTW